jgi:hypothetical protein
LARGDALRASGAYRESANCGEDRPAPLCSWFILSLFLENAAEAEESGKRIEEMLSPAAEEPDFCIAAYKALRRNGSFNVRIRKRGGALFGQHTTRMADALA